MVTCIYKPCKRVMETCSYISRCPVLLLTKNNSASRDKPDQQIWNLPEIDLAACLLPSCLRYLPERIYLSACLFYDLFLGVMVTRVSCDGDFNLGYEGVPIFCRLAVRTSLLSGGLLCLSSVSNFSAIDEDLIINSVFNSLPSKEPGVKLYSWKK